MKFKDVENMKEDEMEKKVAEIKLELLKLNAQVATGTNPKNPLQIKLLKKSLAQILTAKRKKEISLAGGTKKL